MTQSEALKAVSMIRAIWGARGAPDADGIHVWASLLADLDFGAVKGAIERLAKTSKWLPTVAEIRAEVVEDRADLPEPEVAWGFVWRAISKYGERQRPQFAHDEIRQAVDAIGWSSICLDENVAASRARFTDAYRAIRAKRIEREATGRYVAPDRQLEARDPMAELHGVEPEDIVSPEEAAKVISILTAKVSGG